MGYLENLVAHHIAELSGAEFKLAAYLLRRLQRRPELTTTIASLAQATGISWRQTQSALRVLANQNILQVDGRRRGGTRCSRPSLPGQAQPDRMHSKTAASSRRPGPKSSAAVATATAVPPASVESAAPQPSAGVAAPPESQEAHRLVQTLLDTRQPIMPMDFDILLQTADGQLDRLLKRLLRLAAEKRRFEHVRELGSVIRGMVLIR